MSGALLALGGQGASGGGGGGIVIPNPLEWTDAYGDIIAHTGVQTVTGITTPISVAATLSGGGTLHVTQNGAGREYGGPFSVSAGDTLVWSIVNLTTLSVSGTITITNGSDGGATLDAPTYTATGSS